MGARCALAATGGCGPATGKNILHRIDELVVGRLARFAHAVPDNKVISKYTGFAAVDEQIFPLQYAAGTESRDVLQVVRLSPVDAQRGFSARQLDDKVCGTSLGAFGGFFKKPWRANDIMWGRLDALCQIVECTFTKERIRKIASGTNSIDMSTRLAAMFPTSTREVVQILSEQLAPAAELSDADFDALVSALVEAGQREIVAVEWRQVISSAIEQEREWGHHQVERQTNEADAYSATTLAWRQAKQKVDPLIVALAAQSASAPQLELFKNYSLAGRHFVEEIPRPVLLELLTLAIMRLEKSVTAELPGWRNAQLGFLHRLLFRWCVPMVHGWARFSRTSPEYALALTAAVFVASCFGIAFGLVQMTMTVTKLQAFGVFVGSIAVLAILIVFFSRK